MLSYLKKEKVMTIAFILAIISAFFIKPDREYISYIDIRVLSLLFCLMLIVKGFQEIGLFDIIIERFVSNIKNSRALVFLLVFTCFFVSMIITNDVALITFVPFAILTLRLCKMEKLMIPVIVLQTVAANLGSMFTPIGNPQNLYLYITSNMSLGHFLYVTGPITFISFILIFLGMFLIPNEKIEIALEKKRYNNTPKEEICLGILFLVNMLVVLRIISWIPALIMTILGVVVIGQRYLIKKVDYALLLTFIGFFIFVGNLGRIPIISHLVERLLEGREIMIAFIFSQFLSNVPATLLLCEFSDKYDKLLLGVNIGGLGTLIASMASLISYKLYGAEFDAKKGMYILAFTGVNILLAVILLVFTCFRI